MPDDKKCPTFEELRDSMDENKLIEAAIAYAERDDDQPMLTGLKEWIEEAQK